MKKITSLLLFLLMFVSGTAWAQVAFETSDAPTSEGWAANTKWYKMTLKGYYVSSADTDVDENLYANKTEEPYGAAAMWCIVGDATNGYKIYNKQAGPSKVLGMSNMNNDGKARAQMCDPSNTSLATSFELKTKGNESNIFYMVDKASGQYINQRDGFFSNWTNTNAYGDNGSKIRFYAPIANDQAIYIRSARGYMYASADHSKLLASAKNVTDKTDDYKFVLYQGIDGTYYLWNVGAEKFVHKGSDKYVILSDTPELTVFEKNTNNAIYPFNLKVGGEKLNHNSAGNTVTQWEAEDEGNRWTFEPAIGNIDETTIATIRKPVNLCIAQNYISLENVLGAYTPSDLTDLKQKYEAAQSSYTNETEEALEAAIKALSSKSRISLSNTAVYKLKNAHAEKRGYIVYDETTPGYPNLASVEMPGYESNYASIEEANIHSDWAVYTSSFSGRQYIYNITNHKFMKPNAAFNEVDFSEDAVPVNLTDNSSVTYSKQFGWDGTSNILCMACGKGRNNKSVIINNKNDGGRPVYFILQEGQTVSEDLLKVIEAEVALYENGTAVQGFVGALSDDNCASARTLMTGENRNATNAATVLELIKDDNNKNKLVDGGYYRVINAVPGFKKQKGLVCDDNGNTTRWNTVDKSNVYAVYQIIADNGKYVIKSGNANKYIQGVMGAMNANMTSNGHVELVALGGAQYNVKFGNGNMHAENHNNGQGSNGNLVDWNTEAFGASAWYFVPATELEVSLTTVGEHDYATTSLPFPVSAISGAKAYTGAINTNADAITMSEATSFAANEGVLLMGDKGAGKAVLTIGGEAAKVEGNVLQGTCSTIALTADNRNEYRVLGANAEDDSEVGFFRPSDQVTSIPANRAFLSETAFAGLANSLSVNFGGMVEGIQGTTVNAAQSNASVYDLTGRRVVRAVKGGVYIQNGKKFIVK